MEGDLLSSFLWRYRRL